MTYLSRAGGAFGATSEIYPRQIETEDETDTMEWRKCVRCHQRFLAVERGAELCTQCEQLREYEGD